MTVSGLVPWQRGLDRLRAPPDGPLATLPSWPINTLHAPPNYLRPSSHTRTLHFPRHDNRLPYRTLSAPAERHQSIS